MARSYKRDSRGRFAGGGGGRSGRAVSVTGKTASGRSFKGEVGVRGKRLENKTKSSSLPESGSYFTRRKVGGDRLSQSTGQSRFVGGSTPRGTIGKTRKARNAYLSRLPGSGATKVRRG